MGLHVGVQLVEFLHAGFARGLCLDGGTKFLKVNTDPIKLNAAPAMGTPDACNCRHKSIRSAFEQEGNEHPEGCAILHRT